MHEPPVFSLFYLLQEVCLYFNYCILFNANYLDLVYLIHPFLFGFILNLFLLGIKLFHTFSTYFLNINYFMFLINKFCLQFILSVTGNLVYLIHPFLFGFILNLFLLGGTSLTKKVTEWTVRHILTWIWSRRTKSHFSNLRSSKKNVLLPILTALFFAEWSTKAFSSWSSRHIRKNGELWQSSFGWHRCRDWFWPPFWLLLHSMLHFGEGYLQLRASFSRLTRWSAGTRFIFEARSLSDILANSLNCPSISSCPIRNFFQTEAFITQSDNFDSSVFFCQVGTVQHSLKF